MPTPAPHRSIPSRCGRPAAAIALAAAVGGVGLYLRNPSQRWDVRTDVKIAASPDEVWRTLVDFAAYPDWNPFLVEMHGDPTEGAPLTGVSRLSGGRRFGFNSTVTRAEVQAIVNEVDNVVTKFVSLLVKEDAKQAEDRRKEEEKKETIAVVDGQQCKQ